MWLFPDQRLVPDLFFFFFKKKTKGKIKWSAAKFQYISIALKLACNENKLSKTFDNAIDPEICSISIF